MSTLTLAFAENILHHDDNDYSPNLLSDNNTFPPLSSTTNGFEVISDDVRFTGESTVWVNARTYAEAAEKGGVVHEPISVTGAFIAAPMNHQQYTPIPKLRIAKEQYDDDDDCVDYLYYDVKSLSTDKATAENTMFARKLKTVEYTYNRDLRANLQRLPEYAQEVSEKSAEEIQDAKDFIEACQKVAAYLGPPHFKTNLRPDWYYDGTIDDAYSNFHRRIRRAYKNDPMVERVLEEMGPCINLKDRYYYRNPKLHRSSWLSFHWEMQRALEDHLIPLYEDRIAKLDYTQSRTRKQRLWLIRSAIPEKKYMHPKASRTQCAHAILDEYE
ncbi:hypothetical protein BJV82DRAFT_633898 [Fennellomyces sp. T-0311]|nr:hypothetical protein BJV82DRAFT_633898 [Fennellomyces sp. T-0311]